MMLERGNRGTPHEAERTQAGDHGHAARDGHGVRGRAVGALRRLEDDHPPRPRRARAGRPAAEGARRRLDPVERPVRERLPLPPDARGRGEGPDRRRGRPAGRARPDRDDRRRLDRRRRRAAPGRPAAADGDQQQPDRDQRPCRRVRGPADRDRRPVQPQVQRLLRHLLRGGAALAARRRRLPVVLGDPRRLRLPPGPGGRAVQAPDAGGRRPALPPGRPQQVRPPGAALRDRARGVRYGPDRSRAGPRRTGPRSRQPGCS